MFNSLFRKQLESLLATFLPPKTQIKSSTLLQAYATFTAISSKKDENFSTAYAKIRAETNAYPYGILRISGPISSSAPLAFRHFLSLDPENFLRFIVSDMVNNPSNLLQIFQKNGATIFRFWPIISS